MLSRYDTFGRLSYAIADFLSQRPSESETSLTALLGCKSDL